MATVFHAGSSGAPVKVLIVLPIISLLPGGGGGRWPSMPFLLWSRHGKVSHAPSSLVKDLLLPGHSFPIWNDRLRAGPTDTLCTGWLWWQQASPNQCPLSPGSDEPHGRGCLDCSVCTSLPWVTHLPTCPDWTRRLQAEMGTGLLPSRSL